MTTLVGDNEILLRFRERNTAELKYALREVKWWKEQVAKGLVKPENAAKGIRDQRRIIEMKRHVLGFPKLPC